MLSPADRLVHMVNQIARNLAVRGEDAAALAVADHVAAFWDPRMKARLLTIDARGLDPIAARAVALLRRRGAPPPQSGATVFAPAAASGGSDAG